MNRLFFDWDNIFCATDAVALPKAKITTQEQGTLYWYTSIQNDPACSQAYITTSIL